MPLCQNFRSRSTCSRRISGSLANSRLSISPYLSAFELKIYFFVGISYCVINSTICMIVRRRASYRFIINLARSFTPSCAMNSGHQCCESYYMSTRSNMLLVYISSSRLLFIFLAILSPTSIH